MTHRRLVPLALLVTLLLGVVALAAHGRPLSGGSSTGGPSLGFLDYVYTTAVILVIGVALVIAGLVLLNRPSKRRMTRGRRSRLATAVFLGVMGLLFWGLAASHFAKRLHHLQEQLNVVPPKGQRRSKPTAGNGRNPRGVQLRWDEVAVLLALLGALGVGTFVARRRRGVPTSWQLAPQAAVSLALDESLDDLRTEPDLRKAIIAAYARMEHALAVAGLPRRPSEAPLEYLERALGELETSAGAIRRLTDLFEWAKFSHHEPEPQMRDEAIDALVTVRDELRAPAAEPVAA